MELRGLRGARLRRPSGRRALAVGLLLALYLAAALAATWPGIQHFRTDFAAGGAPGYGEASPGDHLQTLYRYWLVGHQLENGAYPWRDPYSFRPETSGLINAGGWPFGFAYWPLWRAFGVVAGWNVLVLLVFVAAGLLAYAWLRELGLGRGAAIAGGLAFEIAPYRVAQSVGHLLGPISVLLPLALWAYERGRRGSPLWYLLSANALASIPLSGQVHVALAAVPFFLAYALARSRKPWPVAGAVFSVALAVGAGVVVRLLVIEDTRGRSLSAVDQYSANGLDFVTRHARHGSESFVFLGWLTPLAAIVGLAWLVWRRQHWLAAVLLVSAGVPILLAFGTNTPVYGVVRTIIPPLRYPRVPERLMPVACLVIACLAAYAVDALLSLARDPEVRSLWRAPARLPWLTPAVVAAGVAVVVFGVDLRVSVFRTSEADAGNRAYAALTEQNDPGRLLELPIFLPDIHFGGVYPYYNMTSQLDRIFGYSTTAPKVVDEIARRLEPLNCGDWTIRPRRFLRQNGIRFIAFHKGLFTLNPEVPQRQWFAWKALTERGYRLVARDGAVFLLSRRAQGELRPPPFKEPSHDLLHYCGGWTGNKGTGRAMELGHTGFWIYGSGDLRLFMRSFHRLFVRFGIDGRRRFGTFVSDLRQVRVPLGGEGWHLVTLDAKLPKVNGKPEGARLVAFAKE